MSRRARIAAACRRAVRELCVAAWRHEVAVRGPQAKRAAELLRIYADESPPYAGSGYAAAGNAANQLTQLGALSQLYPGNGGSTDTGVINFGSGPAQSGPGLSVPIDQPTY